MTTARDTTTAISITAVLDRPWGGGGCGEVTLSAVGERTTTTRHVTSLLKRILKARGTAITITVTVTAVFVGQALRRRCWRVNAFSCRRKDDIKHIHKRRLCFAGNSWRSKGEMISDAGGNYDHCQGHHYSYHNNSGVGQALG
ncbi:hypothetical protein Bbelb_077120 [Branchiostoma belcheri]|nr:hypothetical protein Bbelb_077120 [Branchiostoma belcheri]